MLYTISLKKKTCYSIVLTVLNSRLVFRDKQKHIRKKPKIFTTINNLYLVSTKRGSQKIFFVYDGFIQRNIL